MHACEVARWCSFCSFRSFSQKGHGFREPSLHMNKNFSNTSTFEFENIAFLGFHFSKVFSGTLQTSIQEPFLRILQNGRYFTDHLKYTLIGRRNDLVTTCSFLKICS